VRGSDNKRYGASINNGNMSINRSTS